MMRNAETAAAAAFFHSRNFWTIRSRTMFSTAWLGIPTKTSSTPAAKATERFQGTNVTPNVFQFLGMPALLGRGITPDDGKPGAPPVFVMSYKLWLKEFNLDPKCTGPDVRAERQGAHAGGHHAAAVHLVGSGSVDTGAARPQRSGSQAALLRDARRISSRGSRCSRRRRISNVIAHRLARVYPKDYPKKFNDPAGDAGRLGGRAASRPSCIRCWARSDCCS